MWLGLFDLVLAEQHPVGVVLAGYTAQLELCFALAEQASAPSQGDRIDLEGQPIDQDLTGIPADPVDARRYGRLA